MIRMSTRILVASLAMLAVSAAPAAAKVSGPNGRIVYGVFDEAIEAEHLFTVNPDGSDVRDLSVISVPGADKWSPDGTRILISDLHPGQLPLRPATINPDGSGFVRLDATYDPLLHLGCSAWSPDGDRIACQGFTEEPSEKNGIYTVRSYDGGGLVRVTHARPPGDVPGDYSPDGSRIVFLRGDPSPHACFECGALFVVNTDGSGLRRITPPDLAQDAVGSWSPDGRWIVFGGREGRLYIVHPDGTGLRQIALHDGPGRSFAGGASWSPDGARIVFSMFWAPNGYQPDLFTARPDGSDLVQVTDTPEFEHTSDWARRRADQGDRHRPWPPALLVLTARDRSVPGGGDADVHRGVLLARHHACAGEARAVLDGTR
jgi:Tol biopolymer transport system component